MGAKEILAKIDELQKELQRLRDANKPVTLFLATKLLEELEYQGISIKGNSKCNAVYVWEHYRDNGSELSVQTMSVEIKGPRYKEEEQTEPDTDLWMDEDYPKGGE